MRVGLGLATIRPGRIGGAETYVQGLLGGLGSVPDLARLEILANAEVAAAYRGSVDDGVSFTLVQGMHADGNSIVRAAALVRAAVFAPRRLPDIASRLDLVHFPVAVAVPKPPLPWVVTLHDVQYRVLPSMFSRAERSYRALAYDRSAARASLVITVSESSREEIIHHLGLDPTRVVAIHHGIDHSRFRPGPVAYDRAARRFLGLPSRFLYFPANLWPHKNHRALLSALSRVNPNVSLVLSGQTSSAMEEIRSHARGEGVSDRVTHIGHIPSAMVPVIYRAAEALVFPSLYEGFGAPPLEAMACGCPAVVSRIAAVTEICGDTAITFDPHDPADIAAKITSVITDVDLRSRLIARGIRRAQAFTWTAAAATHVAAYQSVIDRH